MNKKLIPPTIILISPQMGENIGAAARAMYNFGLTDLRIVTPRDGWPNQAATTMAAGAKIVIDNAKCYDHIKDAISDCHFVAATTARTRDIALPSYTPRTLCSDITPKDNNQKTAFIFGCEKSGLSNEEISYANAIIHINVNPDYGSLNLAQAVGIIAYEWSQHSDHTPTSKPEKKERSATKEEILYLYKHIERNLDQTSFFNIAKKRETMLRNIRIIFSRCTLSSQEVQTLRGILKAMERNK